MKFFEEVETLRGRRIERVKSGIFYYSGWICLILGIVLVSNEIMLGGFLVLTAFPCLMLYPLIRYLLGGKDSLLAVATTVIVEEVLKNEMKNVGKYRNNEKK